MQVKLLLELYVLQPEVGKGRVGDRLRRFTCGQVGVGSDSFCHFVGVSVVAGVATVDLGHTQWVFF